MRFAILHDSLTRAAVPGSKRRRIAYEGGLLMAWVVLIASGVLEAVWATALGRAEGFTRLAPLIVLVGDVARRPHSQRSVRTLGR